MNIEAEFVETKCGHNVCLECYKNLVEYNSHKKCPVCGKDDWIIPIN